MKKIILGIAVVCMLVGIKCDIASASTVSLSKENFDYEWYLKEHPDVEAAFGNDADAVWNFYVLLGEPSGWYGRPSIVSQIGKYDNLTLGVLYTVADNICAAHSNPVERARAAHDWLCQYIDYDYTYSNYYIDDTLLNRKGVCNGYALIYELLARLCGLNCEYVTGVANNGSSSGGHAWNKLTINNQVSYVDCTWDDFTDGYNCVVHDCFMITEERMAWIHDGKVYQFMNGQPVGYR